MHEGEKYFSPSFSLEERNILVAQIMYVHLNLLHLLPLSLALVRACTYEHKKVRIEENSFVLLFLFLIPLYFPTQGGNFCPAIIEREREKREEREIIFFEVFKFETHDLTGAF